MDTIDLLRSLTEGVNSKVNMDFLAQNDDTEELEYVVKTSLTKKEKTVVETDGHKLEEEEEVVVSPPKSYKPKIDRQGNPFKRGPRGPRKKKIPVVEEPIVEELYIESGVEGDILPDSLEEIFDADFVSEGIIDEPVLELKELSFEEEEVVLDEPKDVIDLEDISEEYDELFSSVKPVKFDSKFDFDSEEIDFDKEFGLDDDTDLGKEFEDDFESEDVIDEKSDVVEFEETDSSLEKEFEDIEDFDFDKTDESSDLEAEFESLEDSDFSGFEKDTDIDESSDDFETDDVLDLEDEKEDEAELFETLSNNDIIIDENYALSQIEFEEDLDFDYNAILSKKKLEEQREKSIEEKIVEEKPIEKEIKVEQKMEESIKESKKKSSKKEVEVEVLERVEDKSEARALNKSIEEESIEAVEEVVETIDKTEETEETEDDAFKNCVFYKGMDIEEYLKQNPKYRESFYVEHFYTKEYLNQMLMSGLILMKKGKYFL